MNRRPVNDTPQFEDIYRLSKRHAERFGWSDTNADIRLVAGTSHTPALGDLKPNQWAELAGKWNLDIQQARQRARRVAGKPDASPSINVVNVIQKRPASQAELSAVQRKIAEDNRSRRKRVGPIHHAGIGVFRRNGRIVLSDGVKGRIASCEGSEHQCNRLVILTDDLRTRVLDGIVEIERQVEHVIYDGGVVPQRMHRRKYRDGGIVGVDRRQGSGDWIVDAMRAARGD